MIKRFLFFIVKNIKQRKEMKELKRQCKERQKNWEQRWNEYFSNGMQWKEISLPSKKESRLDRKLSIAIHMMLVK